nr:putative integron gene cassette protein [uncultured bacterium]
MNSSIGSIGIHGFETYTTPHECAASSGDLTFRSGVEDGLGHKEVLRSTGDGAFSAEGAFCHWAQEIGGERDGENKRIAYKRVDSEEGSIVERLEVDRAMKGVCGVEEIRFHIHGQHSRAVGHLEFRFEDPIDRRCAIHVLKSSKVVTHSYPPTTNGQVG